MHIRLAFALLRGESVSSIRGHADSGLFSLFNYLRRLSIPLPRRRRHRRLV